MRTQAFKAMLMADGSVCLMIHPSSRTSGIRNHSAEQRAAVTLRLGDRGALGHCDDARRVIAGRPASLFFGIEDRFDRPTEYFRHTERERQARIVFSGLDRIHGLP